MNKEKKMPSMAKKIGGLAVVGLLGLGAGLGGGLMLQPEPTIQYVNHTIKIPVPVNVTQVVTKEVSVVDKYLSEAITDRGIVDDDYTPTEVFMAQDSALAVATTYLQDRIADKLDDAGIVSDDRDVNLIRIYDDWKDVSVLKSNFKNEDYKFVLKAKVEDTHARDKLYVLATVRVQDGEPEFISIVEE